MKLVIVSGRSGSGKSHALKVLEDLGYYCVDNLPLPLMPALLTELEGRCQSVAISIDVRNISISPEQLEHQLTNLPEHMDVTRFYLYSEDEVLLKRYSETRRLHPLNQYQGSLLQAIAQEKQLLAPLANIADHYIDTSKLTIYELADTIRESLFGAVPKELKLTFLSFGFKHGMPREADYVFDVRFLPNPHWEPELRPHTGLEKPVIDYLDKQESVQKLMDQVGEFINTWLPSLEQNNRSYVTFAFGCTGGKHRSVYLADQLAKRFAECPHKVDVRHRELQ
ncbi:RNase adapter RapZ [Paraferrimonas sedimenticola]|uniref:Nucleotide-binding protein n=1 Tax=Paraferrimonas sedimenticola TaxID=375674 RepID=A0AA37RVV3_9GAMM|nr:RNase adapter RapZ [Paraferrimonas sedimenticola]GLP95834.1 nucleotide-binding protein [Paraferrimonas sedimenticola]